MMTLIHSLWELIQRMMDDPTTFHCSIGGFQDMIEQLTQQLRDHYTMYSLLDPATWFLIWAWIMMMLMMLYKFLGFIVIFSV